MNILDQVKQVVDSATVFGEAYERDGVTIIPASKVSGGGGGGQGADEAGGAGVGFDARPAGAFVIKEGSVSWIPALDVNRIVLLSQLALIVGLLTIRSIARTLARRR